MTTLNQPYIRDELTIDERVQEFYKSCTGDGPVLLLGRIVKHATTLRVDRQPLIIVADLYDGTSGIIDASGIDSGAVGVRGIDGVSPWPGYDPITEEPTGPGGDGGLGGDGGPGGNGVAVTVYCRRSINAGVSAMGGMGAPGGAGGNGGRGVDGFTIPDQVVWVDDTPDDLSNFSGHEELIPGRTVDGTPGGNGGAGGNGGNGGNGGRINFTSIVDDTLPSLDVRGGVGGRGGAGGAAGVDGAGSQSAAGEGPTGLDGDPGAEGQATHTNVSEADYIAGLRSVLDMPGASYANHWAPFRIDVGDYFYHRYNPSVPTLADFSRLAAVEFARALELQPKNGEALRLQEQLVGVRQAIGTDDFVWVGGGNNALGLPHDLDVLPNFEAYMDAFVKFSAFAMKFLSMGMNALVQSVTLDNLRELARFHGQQASQTRDNIDADLSIAISEKRLAGDEADRVQQLLDQTTAEIMATRREMEQSRLEVGDIPGTVAAVAVAVVSVAAAIPSAGTSLVALAPAMVALAKTTIDHAEPIAKAVFESREPDVKKVKEAYEKVDKKFEAVIKGGKSIVNFVEVLNKLNASTTPDNPKHLALVRRGVDLTHQVLLARNKVTLVQQRVEATRARLAGAAMIVAEAERLAEKAQSDAESIRDTGFLTIGVVQSKADALLGMAFRAQRSVEIYTLEALEQHLRFDTGLLHPDDTRDYAEGKIPAATLIAKLQQSWLQLLEPITFQQRYTNYFEREHGQDRLRLSFTAQDPQFRELQSTRRCSFRIEASDIPADRADAKVIGVRLALVGASHPANGVSCEVRHGARYEQRGEDGTIHVQDLKSLIGDRIAKTERLAGDEGLGSDPVPPAPGSLAFWGRGIGGDWQVSIAPSRLNSELDLSGLTEIQVWIGYRFLR